MDNDAFAVADDEQRRVFQLQSVVGELLEGGVEVAPRLFVFPAEMAALPDISPAVARTGFFGTALKAVVVRVTRFFNTEQFAKIVKMSLRPAAFGEFVVFPQGDELFGGHGAAGGGERLQCSDADGIGEMADGGGKAAEGLFPASMAACRE